MDRATGHGGIGAILLREGIYSSTLHGWRKEHDAAIDDDVRLFQLFLYRRDKPVNRPTLGPCLGLIDHMVKEDHGKPKKEKRTARRIRNQISVTSPRCALHVKVDPAGV